MTGWEKRKQDVFVGVIVLVMSVGLTFPASAMPDPNEAHTLVGDTINQLLETLAKDKALFQKDEQKLLAAVETVLGELVDFNRIARRVMAKYYRKATDQQKKRFAVIFRQSLLNTYAKGLIEFEDYKVRLLPMKTGSQTDRNTMVDFEVVTASGQVFPITQSLFFHNKKKQWMVQNVIINGVNIGLLFREQFARLVTASNGDISAAIEAWQGSVKQGAEDLKKKETQGDPASSQEAA